MFAVDGAFLASLANGFEEIGETFGIVVDIKGLPKLLAIAVDEENLVGRLGVVDGDDKDFTIVFGLG